MQATAAECAEVLLDKIIKTIFYHTDSRDIVRWRTVSKWFHAITYDPVLWKNLYADAPFPRPPGPFPSQSNASLERNLVKSARLAQSWTTRPMRDVSCVKIELKGEPVVPGPPQLIHGRWLSACELGRRFVLHDTETGVQRVLWEQEKIKVPSWSWDMCSMTSPEGQCVMYVLLQPEYKSSGWKLLEFWLNDGSGELVDSAVAVDGPEGTDFGYYEEKHRARKSPLLSMRASDQYLVFDTRTRVFYKFPRLHIALDDTFRYIGSNYRMGTRIALTNTCIISLIHYNYLLNPITVIQVFTLPPDGSSVKNGNRVLRLTHEGVVDDLHLADIEALKSLVDSVTGATHLRLINLRHDFQVTRIDLTLPKPRADEVSPMTVEMRHYMLLKEGEPTSPHGYCSQYVDVSEEGVVRGFYRGTPRRRHFEDVENDHVMKFTIDTRQDEWVIDRGKLSPVEWSHLGDTSLDKNITFDGMRGKICFADRNTHYKNMVVLDIE